MITLRGICTKSAQVQLLVRNCIRKPVITFESKNCHFIYSLCCSDDDLDVLL